jgi:subfamily B ATP-binding cassette protein MsbA
MKLFLRTFGFLKPYWKHMGAIFVLSVLFVLFNSFALWMSASFVTALFSNEEAPAQAKEVTQVGAPESPAGAEAGGVEEARPARGQGGSSGGTEFESRAPGETESIGASPTPTDMDIEPASEPFAAGSVPGAGLNEKLKAKTNALIMRDSKSDTLKILCIVIFLAFVFKNLCSYGKNVLLGFVEQRVTTDIRDKLYAHLQSLSLAYFHRKRLGEMASVVMNDVGVVNSTLTTTFDKIIVTPINLLWLVALLFIINWKVALFFLILVPINGFIIAKIGSSIRRKSRRSQRQIAEVVATLHESLNNIKIVMAFAMNRFEVERFKRETKRYFRLVLRLKVLRAVSSPVTEILGAAIGVGILWYAGNQVLRSQMMTSEDFIRSLVIMFSILQPLKGLGGINNALQAGMAASERIFEMLDTKPVVTERAGAAEKTFVERGVSIEAVSFRYSPELPFVLKDVSLEVEKGRVLALVGPSGAGKSTLIDLIPRFYDVTEGAIKIDGIDVRDLKLASLRRLMGIVTQETILFNDSVRNNIAYGMREVPIESVREAARVANALEFIEAMDAGFETKIGERGVRLSGGQKQRIAIARAILQNPPVLLLDEATSSLDSESEHLVQEALGRLMKDRTVIVIAHRLSTVIDADKIAVMKDGVVEAIGKHRDLLETSKLYNRLYQMQFGFSDSPAEEYESREVGL